MEGGKTSCSTGRGVSGFSVLLTAAIINVQSPQKTLFLCTSSHTGLNSCMDLNAWYIGLLHFLLSSLELCEDTGGLGCSAPRTRFAQKRPSFHPITHTQNTPHPTKWNSSRQAWNFPEKGKWLSGGRKRKFQGRLKWRKNSRFKIP